MHTPEEAKNLWCPMVLHQGYGEGSFNREMGASINCIADKCAMWRWVPTTESLKTQGPAGATIYEQRTVKTHGYCGLAGVQVM